MVVERYILAMCTKVSFKPLIWEFSMARQGEEFVNRAPLPGSNADCRIYM
jgi:hypothetical protein